LAVRPFLSFAWSSLPPLPRARLLTTCSQLLALGCFAFSSG
jgi:hypothetical protein